MIKFGLANIRECQLLASDVFRDLEVMSNIFVDFPTWDYVVTDKGYSNRE